MNRILWLCSVFALTLSLSLSASSLNHDDFAKRYQIHSNGTVSDHITGLMWKQCSEGLSGSSCQEGEAQKYEWQSAMSLKGSHFAGYDDWQLPTIEQLRSLVFCSNGTPAEEAWDNACGGKNDKNGKYQKPTISQSIFLNTKSSWYWSSSLHDNSDIAWVFDFSHGYGFAYKDYNKYVRLVRVGQ